jgi:hypothetical protein
LEASQRIIATYNCEPRRSARKVIKIANIDVIGIEPVLIEALCCFDTVGTRGIPKTGLLGILKLSPTCFSKHEFRETSPGDSE